MAMHRNAGTPNLLEKNETNTLLLPVVGLDSRTTAGNTDYHLSLLYANNNNFDKFDIARGVPTFIRLSYKPPDSDGVKSILYIVYLNPGESKLPVFPIYRHLKRSAYGFAVEE